jgi:hypothetical protein
MPICCHDIQSGHVKINMGSNRELTGAKKIKNEWPPVATRSLSEFCSWRLRHEGAGPLRGLCPRSLASSSISIFGTYAP